METSPVTLAEVQSSERFEGYVLVRSAEYRTSTAGKTYIDINVSDRSGLINGKMWDGSHPLPKVGSVIRIRATGNEFNGRMQLRVEKMEKVQNPEDIDWSQLVPSAPIEAKQMLSEIRTSAEAIEDPDYRALTCALLKRAGDALLYYPAAKQMHHAERGGLLYHTLTMLRVAQSLLPIYPHLNASLLIAGVICHDLAKIDEMDADSTGYVQDYSLDGKLIGHIVRGVINVAEEGKALGIHHEKMLLLEHMILSHHGLAEYGSPKQPMIPEAEVLNLIDTLDARLNEMESAIVYTTPGSFSEKVRGLDNRQIYRAQKS